MNFSAYTVRRARDIAVEFKTSLDDGLAVNEAASRLTTYGRNQISGQRVYWWHILLRQLKSSFIYLLIGAAVLSFLLQGYLNGLMILLFVAINTALGFYQEYHSERTLKLLKKYTVPTVNVIREGKKTVIESSTIVPGDIVVVTSGDIIPADLKFFKTQTLLVDESVLTGESVPVNKISRELTKPASEPYQALNIGFSGTTVIEGQGEGVVVATGRQTVIGEVSRLTVETERESSFERSISKISRFILRLIILTLIFVFLANLLIKGGEADVVELLIFSIALAVSVIPEALPVVTTFSLSRGALRLAKNKVVVKRLSAIEDLGSFEILCTDKTGTLTENKLTVAHIYAADKKEALFYAAVAAEETHDIHSAFDTALFKRLSLAEQAVVKRRERLSAIPFDPERKRNSVLIRSHGKLELVVRGAAELIVQGVAHLSAIQQSALQQWMTDEGRRGCRVIAVAKKQLTSAQQYHVKQEERGLTLLGLISFTDPIKRTTKQAIIQAERLGVAIKILTGDSKAVAGAVAHTVGLIKNPDEAMTGEEFERLPHPEQHGAMERCAVFARLSPQQKFKIIQMLQEKHEIGFLGEGINDAPALKIANVGLAVQGASDIAREAADIILLNKSLEVIVDGIREGRSVFSNTIKYIKSTLTSNFGNFFAIAIASLLVPFLPMLPLQILLVNLLSDFPMIAVATDTVDPQELRKPRSYDIREIALLAVLLGVVSTVFDFIFFGLFVHLGQSILQTNWFIGSILTELVFIFCIRTRLAFWKAKRPSAILLWLSVIAVFLTIIITFLPLGRTIFQFTPPSLGHLLLIIALVVCYFAISEGVKRMYYTFMRPSSQPI